MLNILKAESLKEKGSSNRRLIFIVPLIFIIFCGAFATLMTSSTEKISNFIAIVYNWFPLMLTPILISLISSGVIMREKNERLTDYHRSLLVSPRKIWLSKIIVAVTDFVLIYLAVLALALLTEGVIYGQTEFLGLITVNALVLIILNVALIPFSIWLSSLTNPFVVIMVNFLLTFGTISFASADYWWASPWSYGFRTTAALLGIHPNGTYLPSDSPLLKQSVVPVAVIISLGLLIVTSLLTMFLYESKVSNK